ncbi:MAG: hypothetical protein HC897_03555, partial [Thermoanaerobaculia bacterium]|nr:hypothetical protein [Thermoanaerobaculia bacterium]
DEVVPPEAEPGLGQLRDSNTAFLLAAGDTLGLGFRSLGIAPDRTDELREKITEGLESDVLLLCGGVSMGEFDLVEDVLAELGCRKLFDQVAIQPGKPLVAARHAGGWVFGLPGNPASVMVTFWLFVRPLLRRLMGSADGFGTARSPQSSRRRCRRARTAISFCPPSCAPRVVGSSPRPDRPRARTTFSSTPGARPSCGWPLARSLRAWASGAKRC